MATAGFGAYALTLLRVIVGLTFLLHGLPKWGNLGGVAGFFGNVGIPAPSLMAPWVAFLETVGGLALIVGVATRYAGVLLAIEMVVTTVVVKWPRVGFIAPLDRPGVGAELDLLLLAGALVVATLGPGRLSVEGDLLKRQL
ncbi:MAG: DoxX family protein [Armatimonadota bacterium]|nr:DoxX family protein [Armatimonadota bacterium]